MAVARAWTLAYGVMSEQEWPDRIPESFAKQHGVTQLRDTVTPEIPANVVKDARRHAEETRSQVKELIFPTHGLSG